MSGSLRFVVQPQLLVCISLSLTEGCDGHSATVTYVLTIGGEFTVAFQREEQLTGYFRRAVAFVRGRGSLEFERMHGNN